MGLQEKCNNILWQVPFLSHKVLFVYKMALYLLHRMYSKTWMTDGLKWTKKKSDHEVFQCTISTPVRRKWRKQITP
jgi:hypothetical protein